MTFLLLALATTNPTALDNLEACYLDIAKKKTNADMAYVARQLCDAIYKPKRRSIVVLDPKSRSCQEWWLDSRGRYETEAVYCVFEPTPGGQWSLACQDKSQSGRYSLVQLQQSGTRFERQGELIGFDPGEVFPSLAGCIAYRAQRRK